MDTLSPVSTYLGRMTMRSTLLIAAAGLFGALGVAAAAVAAHGGDGRLVATAAAILLVHAPALLALAALDAARLRFVSLAGGLLITGALLFSGDLAARELLGNRLFPNAAPIGGMLLIAGWLVTMAGALATSLTRSRG